METPLAPPTAEEARSALRDAQASRTRLADGIEVPSWFSRSLGVAIAAQIGTTATGLGSDAAWARWALVGGLVVFVLTAGVQLTRFRRRNGVWLGGFAGHVVLGTGTAASASYALALGIAIWAALDGLWWLVVLGSIAGGAAYALSGRRWMRAYRRAPELHGRGESAAWLALVTLAAIAGLALLVLER